MQCNEHDRGSPLGPRRILSVGALLAALLVSGCSAVNMTGFSFPVFGLTKKSSAETDGLTTSSVREDETRPAAESQSLTSQ